MSTESSIADLTMEMFEEDCREQLLTHIKEVINPQALTAVCEWKQKQFWIPKILKPS